MESRNGLPLTKHRRGRTVHTGPKCRCKRYKEGIIYALQCGNNHLDVLEGLGLYMLRRHLNWTASETVGLTDNAVANRTGANCTALFSSGSSHISARETVDICMCVDVTLSILIDTCTIDNRPTVRLE